MDPVTEIDFIRSREVNVPYEGFKGMLKELYREGPLTILFAAGVGAALGGIVLAAAPLVTGAAVGMSALPFVGLAAGASALLTTAFVATRGFLEGRRDALEKNTLIDHMAELHKGEIAMRGLEVKKEIEAKTAQREGGTAAFIKNIINGGRQGSPASHAESVLAMRSDENASLGQKR